MMKYFLSFALALMTIILFSQAGQLNDHYLNDHYKNTIYLIISVLFANIFIFVKNNAGMSPLLNHSLRNWFIPEGDSALHR